MISTSHGRMFEASGGNLSYFEVGDQQSPCLLLLHSVPQSSYVFSGLLPLFGARFRAVAVDLMGAGDSDKAEDVGLDVSSQARYVGELLSFLGVERLAVIGHGLGGAVAQLLATDGAGVEAMVLIASEPVDAPASGDLVSWTRSTAALDPHGPLTSEALESLLVAGMPGEGPREDALDEYLRPFQREGGAAAFLRIMTGAVGEPVRSAEQLAAIEVPVLILWGEDDPVSPVSSAELLNEAIPSSSLGLLPGCGHFLLDEAGPTIVPMIYEYLRARYLQEPHGHADTGPVAVQLARGRAE